MRDEVAVMVVRCKDDGFRAESTRRWTKVLALRCSETAISLHGFSLFHA